MDMRRANALTWVGIWAAALVLLVGCLAPTTPEEAIGRTYVAITSVSEAAIQAYEAGLISRDDAEEIWHGVQSALTITTQAQQTLLEGGPIDDPLQQVQAILQVIQNILTEAQHERE